MKEAEALSAYDSTTFNFKFSGFSLHSTIKIQGEGSVPESQETLFPEREGIIVKLHKDGNAINRVATNKFGEFTFDDIEPGQYTVRAEEAAKSAVKFLSQSFSCTYSIEKGPNCTGEILIVGTKFSREVLVAGEPLNSGILHLRSTNSNLLKSCAEASKQAGLAIAKGFDCSVKIVRGTAQYSELPHGVFEVSVQAQNPALKLTPAVLKASHPAKPGHEQALELKAHFENLTVKVQTVDGDGISGAEITINGALKGATKASGEFIIDKIEFQQYSVEVKHPQYQFETISVLVDAESYKKLEIIRAQKYAICGKIDFKNDPEPASYDVIVYLEGSSPRDVQTTKIDNKGGYCFMASAGTYLVRPSVNLKGRNMPVIPKQRTVTVQSSPISNADFSREQLVIKGTIEYLPGTTQEQKQATEIILLSAENTFVKSVKPNTQGNFEFKDLLEDGYSLKLSNKILCFAKDTFGPNEFSAEAVKFTQKGIQLHYNTKVSFKAKVNGQLVSFDRNKPSLCLGTLGKVKVEVEDLYLFKKGLNNFTLDTTIGELSQLHFEVDKVRVSGFVRLDTASISRIDGLAAKLTSTGSIKLAIKAQGATKATQQIELTSTGQANTWKYTTHLQIGGAFELAPTFGDKELTDRLVVSPSSLQVDSSDLSQFAELLQEFNITAGKIVQVKFSKEVRNATVKLLWRRSSANRWSTFIKDKRSGELAVFSSLDHTVDYDVKVSKVGFVFSTTKAVNKQGDITFTINVAKISELVIKVTDEQSKPLEGVSVYLTSMNRENFLKTTLLSNSQGSVRRSLSPSSYFTKFALKEYEFVPAQKTLTITEGEKTLLKVKAKRTQFSVFGTVRGFGGNGVKGIRVEATCEDRGNEMVEEGFTDNNGGFVIKGLVPGKRYSIKVKAAENLIAMPDSRSFIIGTKDTLDVNFVLASEWSTRSLKGQVVLKDFSTLESKTVSPLRVVLKEDGSEESTEQNSKNFKSELELHQNRRFEFLNLKKGVKRFELQIYTKQSTTPVYSTIILAEDLKAGLTVLQDVVIHKQNLNDQPESNLHFVSLFVTVGILVSLFLKFRK